MDSRLEHEGGGTHCSTSGMEEKKKQEEWGGRSDRTSLLDTLSATSDEKLPPHKVSFTQNPNGYFPKNVYIHISKEKPMGVEGENLWG